MKYALVIVATFAFSALAFAHGDEKGPNGGQMMDVAGVAAELLVSGNAVTINVFDESKKPISTKGFTAAALIVQGADRETVTLGPVNENSLKGNSKNPINPQATVTVTLKTANGKSGQVKFKP